MTGRKFRVGIVGADTRDSWSGGAHVPALAAQSSLILTAVATRREGSAKAAAEAFGAGCWYSDPYEMIQDEAIDVVTIAVRVPAHRNLVMAALEAGKAVYSESPLGASVREAEEMAAAVGPRHTAIGLLGRHNPAVRRAVDLVASCRLGRVLSARVLATTVDFGPRPQGRKDYFSTAAPGASLLTITTGHVLDVVEAVLGNIGEVDARTEILWPEIEIVGAGGISVREVPDHVDLIAMTASGVPVSVQVLANVPPEDANFTFDIRGSGGWLKITGNHPAGVQVGDLTLSASIVFDAPVAPVAAGVGPTVADFWAGAAINVGEVYASLARDLVENTYKTPGFDHAVHNSRLVAAVERAAQTGERQRGLG